MRKNIAICLLLALLLAACGSPAGYQEVPTITSPEQYLLNYPEADIIIGEGGTFFVESTRVPWVMNSLDLTDATAAGEVQRSGIQEAFRPWDATILPEGTEIMRHNGENNVMVARVNGLGRPYLKYMPHS
ncbi:MAG: hypothetical protein FWE19_01355 [Oscillospiraceae bacterium]|nr:hypothetical protein [Oscillospiraceae bacterium]